MASKPAGKQLKRNQPIETENNTSPDKRKMKKQKVAGGAAPAGGAAAAAPGKADKKKAATAAAIAAVTGAAPAAGAGAGLTKKQKKAAKAKAGKAGAGAGAEKAAAAAAAAAEAEAEANGSGDDGDAFDDGAQLDALQSAQTALDRIDAKYYIEKQKIEHKIATEKKQLLGARADAVKAVTGFWKTALLGSDQFRSVLNADADLPILDALTDLNVQHFNSAKGTGYTVALTFDTANAALPFTNAKLERTYTFVPIEKQTAATAAAAADADADADEPIEPECTVTCTKIAWKAGAQPDGGDSFFAEFFDAEKAATEKSEDGVGHAFVELFRNPLPFFLDGLDPNGDGDDDDDDDDAIDGDDDAALQAALGGDDDE